MSPWVHGSMGPWVERWDGSRKRASQPCNAGRRGPAPSLSVPLRMTFLSPARGTWFDRSLFERSFSDRLQGRHEMNQSLLLASGLAIILGSGALAARIDNPQAQDQNTTTVTGCLTASADGKTFTITESNAASMARPKNWTLVATGGVESQQVRESQGRGDRIDAEGRRLGVADDERGQDARGRGARAEARGEGRQGHLKHLLVGGRDVGSGL